MSDNAPEISMNPDELYLEEVYTDNKVGTIRRMTPVDANGDADSARPVLFIGSTQMMTPAGPLPLNFELQGSTLGQAAANFGEAANKSLEDTMKELQEMRREQASQIVVPGQGGSQIQMP
ncbi:MULTISPECIES: hypothetical protein [unclassified Oleiphilus]|uniref:hypothetical protein n=2 Tax=Oleiphilus TaxID=141450 RepID=UPI0007C3E639|nr:MULTISPECIES: hypothetical protein [unclassified Oleiphilus]KZY42389.1 hypothetical protein A3732_16360 [Oleiphilus sp. HI0050]KZY79335.1 hypothetical protein A3740_07095 [Oleiphilus sp. HI0068]KZY84526.1 hypothetical protein A3741_03220 [Oleiphilus sp. HI0069]KZY86003.1 hypothetical protein A3743_18005 [Oleiphilus sp. HI0072]KZZ11046.1 hypothetical protein A3749_09800 [Oleiphilus sp. HI0078]KZZ21577.1 hypothetical protein A3752_00075 [Oleiphilus sp. HI0081]KZZ47378.1 hypothetical protein